MIRILLVDPESLLRSSGGAHPDARRALGVLSRLETSQGGHLLLVTAACGKTTAQAADQVTSLGFSDLLAPEVAVRLPPRGDRAERSALAAALQPLLPGAQLGACAAVLRDEERVLSCRWLGVPALAPGFDKIEWRDVPLLVARVMDPSNLRNLGLALSPYVPADVEDVTLLAAEPKRLVGRASRWVPVPAATRALPEGLCVRLPVELSVQIEPNGARVVSFSVGTPSPSEADEAALAVADLFARGEVALAPQLVSPATTYLVEQDDGGRRLLRRVQRMAG
jgi:hypothetical protein